MTLQARKPAVRRATDTVSWRPPILQLVSGKRSPLCHPERSRFPFVIPSEVAPALSSRAKSLQLCHPERSRSSSVIPSEVAPALSSRAKSLQLCHPERSRGTERKSCHPERSRGTNQRMAESKSAACTPKCYALRGPHNFTTNLRETPSPLSSRAESRGEPTHGGVKVRCLHPKVLRTSGTP